MISQIEKYIKKLDQELQKFKLELEADHAGITSKLEQVISSKANPHGGHSSALTNSSMMYQNSTLSGMNFNLNQLNDDSDFTLCTPNSINTHHDLVMMMMNSTNSTNQTVGGVGESVNHHTSSHKRKQSTTSHSISMQAAATAAAAAAHHDEDSSSSWQSAIYQGRKNNMAATPASNRKTNFSTSSYNKVF